jgi:hypothetical protein
MGDATPLKSWLDYLAEDFFTVIFRSIIPVVFTYIRRRKQGPSKHNCLVILFIAAIATTCFGRAWPSSGHIVDVVHKWEKHDCMSGWFSAAVWVEVRCGWGSSGEGFCGLRMCRILSGGDATTVFFLICTHQHCDLKMAKHGRNM